MAWLKSNVLLVLSGLTAVLAFLLKLSVSRSAKLKQQSENFKARAHHAKVVMQKDAEAVREHDIRTEELASEVKEKRTSSELRNPNSDW